MEIDISKYYNCIFHICCSTLRFLMFVWPAILLMLTKFHYPETKTFWLASILLKEKGRFATRLRFSVITNFLNSDIVVPESCISLRFYSMCLYVSSADSDQILLPSVESISSGRFLNEPHQSSEVTRQIPCMNLVESMSRRLQTIISGQSNHTKY